MAGDGINDSAALAQADLSIAMGGGSDIAMDVAKMTIISSDLTKIPEALKLSRLTVRTIRQNLFLGVHLQHNRCTRCSRRTLPRQRLPAESNDSRCSHGIQQCQRSNQQSAAEKEKDRDCGKPCLHPGRTTGK